MPSFTGAIDLSIFYIYNVYICHHLLEHHAASKHCVKGEIHLEKDDVINCKTISAFSSWLKIENQNIMDFSQSLNDGYIHIEKNYHRKYHLLF